MPASRWIRSSRRSSASTRSWRRSSWRSSPARRPAPATSASPAPTPTRSPGGARTRRCRRRTTRASCSSGCSATAGAPIRRCGWRGIRQQRSVLDSVTRGGRAPAGRARRSAIAPSSSNTSTRFATSSGASRRPRSRATRSCRSSIIPAGIPASYEEHVKLMFDLQVLAYQCDLTRVITFMLGREFSGMTYPQIGVPDAHHPISHHQQEPEKIAKVAKINAYHVQHVRLPAGEAAGDARRRRHAARSRDDDVRRGHGRQQRATRRSTSRWCWRAAAPGSSRADATSAIQGHAAGEPAPDAARQVRRALGSRSATAPGRLDDRMLSLSGASCTAECGLRGRSVGG